MDTLTVPYAFPKVTEQFIYRRASLLLRIIIRINKIIPPSTNRLPENKATSDHPEALIQP